MNSFIKKLVRNKTIKLTEPSKIICSSYLQKSDSSLLATKTLLTIKTYDEATALVYYSMYHSALALMFKTGIK